MNKHQGFTIIELMITVALALIVLTIGIPNFRSIIQNNRATTITNDLVTALQTARSEAIKQRKSATVCRRNSSGTDCEDGTDWSVGWLVWRDDDGDDNLDNGEIQKVWDTLSSGANSVTSTNAAGVTFLPTGKAEPKSDFTIDLVLSSCTGNQKRTIGVSAVGRIHSTRSACQ